MPLCRNSTAIRTALTSRSLCSNLNHRMKIAFSAFNRSRHKLPPGDISARSTVNPQKLERTWSEVGAGVC